MNGFTTTSIARSGRLIRTSLAATIAVCAWSAAPDRAVAGDAIPDIQPPAATLSPLPFATPSGIADPKPQRFNFYLQTTNTQQYHGAFPAAYSGTQSITSKADTAKTVDGTAFLGARIGADTEVYLNAEMDQGFGLGTPPSTKGASYAGTFGAGGFPSAESYKVGSDHTYTRIQRAFVRQTFNFGGGDNQTIDPDINQLGGSTAPKNLIVTAGKYSVTDVFDNNIYAHDPKNDFLNWSIVDAGAFDYAADAWGYTSGASAELSTACSTLRAGLFELSAAPNDIAIERVPFRQFGSVLEFEQRTSFFGGHPGAFKGLIYANTGYMGAYDDAVALGLATNTTPTTAAVRTDKHVKLGAGINIAQEVTPHIGVFGRISAMNGTYEAYDFTEIDRSISGGVSINGALYRRRYDTIGLAAALNGLSLPAQRYFAAGGAGLLLGDGALSYGGEQVIETYYRVGFTRSIGITLDYQRLVNPGYNSTRGPISVFGMRYHAQL